MVRVGTNTGKRKELYISESIGTLTWDGLRKENRDLILWLDEPNVFDPGITNMAAIRFSWNILNNDDKTELIQWLDESNVHVPVLTNMEFIRVQWNALNADNRNVRRV